MTRLTWLPDVLRAAGLTVDVLPGWTQRGRSDINPQGLVCHHTVTGPSWPDHRVDHLLRDGHANLAGPLSQLGLRRDGSFVVVASGRCNHNGYGRWGNDSIAIEAYNDGVREPWPAVQMDAYARGCAAILAHHGWGVDRCLGHKETDPNRKTDPTFDMVAFRRRVAALMAKPPLPAPQEDDTMHGAEIIASYAEAYGPLTKQQGKDARAWIHVVYAKAPHERDGAVAYIRALLGLK